MQPLAAADLSSSSQPITRLSRSVSLTVLDSNGIEVSIRTNRTQPIELIIPRDPSLVIPPMAPQDFTAFNTGPADQLFNLHQNDISSSLPISVHFEIQPANKTVGYLFIYKFDSPPILTNAKNQIDGWTLLCPHSE